MLRLTSLFALVFAASVAAAERCGTDDFGNTVCMDKHGVVSTVRPDRVRSDANGSVTTDGSKGESGNEGGRDDKNGRPRCGIDPFGNKVCR